MMLPKIPPVPPPAGGPGAGCGRDTVEVVVVVVVEVVGAVVVSPPPLLGLLLFTGTQAKIRGEDRHRRMMLDCMMSGRQSSQDKH